MTLTEYKGFLGGAMRAHGFSEPAIEALIEHVALEDLSKVVDVLNFALPVPAAVGYVEYLERAQPVSMYLHVMRTQCLYPFDDEKGSS